MKPADLLQLLRDCYAEKARLRARHEAVARLTGQYDVNNTYQYVINREEQQLTWLRDAISGMGGALPELPPPEDASSRGADDAALLRMVGEDADAIDAFVVKWRDRIAVMSNARDKLMIQLMLGEMEEQARLFHQAASGRLDLLGRRTGGERTKGTVLGARWVE